MKTATKLEAKLNTLGAKHILYSETLFRSNSDIHPLIDALGLEVCATIRNNAGSELLLKNFPVPDKSCIDLVLNKNALVQEITVHYAETSTGEIIRFDDPSKRPHRCSMVISHIREINKVYKEINVSELGAFLIASKNSKECQVPIKESNKITTIFFNS